MSDLLFLVLFRNMMSFEMLSSIWFLGSSIMMGVSLNNATKTFNDENHLIQLRSLGFTSNEIKHEFENLVMRSFISLILMRIMLILLTHTFSSRRLFILIVALLSYTALLKWSSSHKI
ncbi:hypothetical protein [Erysipelothrix amsterdamensis]|uniref:hypothetical protein n=1 Tax=Erysipelothrix amsterdamensis TaxID=2929157 RepID=UPI0020A6E670